MRDDKNEFTTNEDWSDKRKRIRENHDKIKAQIINIFCENKLTIWEAEDILNRTKSSLCYCKVSIPNEKAND